MLSVISQCHAIPRAPAHRRCCFPAAALPSSMPPTSFYKAAKTFQTSSRFHFESSRDLFPLSPWNIPSGSFLVSPVSFATCFSLTMFPGSPLPARNFHSSPSVVSINPSRTGEETQGTETLFRDTRRRNCANSDDLRDQRKRPVRKDRYKYTGTF